MQKELKLVEEFHKKLRVPVVKRLTLISRDRADFRCQLMRENNMLYFKGQKELERYILE